MDFVHIADSHLNYPVFLLNFLHVIYITLLNPYVFLETKFQSFLSANQDEFQKLLKMHLTSKASQTLFHPFIEITR